MTFETALIVMKAVHAAGIIVWSGALIALPGMLAERPRDAGPDLDRLHRMARKLYIHIASPAAFLAIATGVALIFARQTFVPWFTLKLQLVFALVMVHVGVGVVMLKVFEPEGRISSLTGSALTLAGIASVMVILWVVLAKPDLDPDALAPGLFEPGGLGRALGFTVPGLS
jgi:putative membrane protein